MTIIFKFFGLGKSDCQTFLFCYVGIHAHNRRAHKNTLTLVTGKGNIGNSWNFIILHGHIYLRFKKKKV